MKGRSPFPSLLPPGLLLVVFGLQLAGSASSSPVEGASATAKTNIASSYCTNSNCNLTSMVQDSAAINAFSATSYHLNASGLLSVCDENNSACGWDGDVEAFNRDAQAVSQGKLRAIPLVFNNAGSMVQNFRQMIAQNHQSDVVEYLVQEAHTFNYSTVSLDLEPSCWNSLASECEFPTSLDVDKFIGFVDELADSLHASGRRLSIAAGSYPISQCDGGAAQYAMCTPDYTVRCSTDDYNASTCNCCAFTSWFSPQALCASHADVIVNMDTYMDSPFNSTSFKGAMQWYLDAGCTVDRLSIGLLANEAATSEETESMFGLIREYGVSEIDVWTNIWSNNVTLGLWRSHLEAFVNA